MKTVCIDGSKMTSRAEAHAQLSEKLSFPQYYGRNLDALYDCLADIHEPTRIVVASSDEAVAHLGAYGAALLHVLRAAAQESDFLTVLFGPDPACTGRDGPDESGPREPGDDDPEQYGGG